jgi:ATP/maltotriose-dependent transcriptional regulator MalT
LSRLALGWASMIAGDPDGAIRQASDALREFRDQDEPYWTAVAVLSVGSVQAVTGRDDDAVGHLGQARELADRFGYHWLATSSRVDLGTLDALRGRLGQAQKLLDEALDLSVAARSTSLVALSLAAHARLAFGEGDPEQTALLEGAADGLRRRVGLRAWPMLRPTETELMTRLRQELGADRLDQALSAGSRLNQQQAVAAVRDRRGTRAQTS